jgi:hypothetical protein
MIETSAAELLLFLECKTVLLSCFIHPNTRDHCR